MFWLLRSSVAQVAEANISALWLNYTRVTGVDGCLIDLSPGTKGNYIRLSFDDPSLPPRKMLCNPYLEDDRARVSIPTNALKQLTRQKLPSLPSFLALARLVSLTPPCGSTHLHPRLPLTSPTDSQGLS
ncbi:hypothetical protein CDV31_015473 [Fusarium ambrosium]|uniref:Uncharacterized protein n=1 Tax=Fusarium ambrosium TaxID=131363 RepID=A0A428SNW8_9HYPO|nr:hypothetical protein CDV31_015473 [Fusarium ambrosium]